MINLDEVLLPGQMIGIIGGGQLGRMMALSAKKMGFRVGVLDPMVDCPAAQVADWHLLAQYDDVEAVKEFAQKAHLLTYEFENVDVDALIAVESMALIPQGTDLLAITQDRLLEKTFLEEQNIVIAPYATIVSPADIPKAIDSIGYPCVLKNTQGSYDGKGQYVLYSNSDLAPSMNLLRNGTCVLEAWIPYDKELAILVAGNAKGHIQVFPIVENVYRNNMLHETIAPARIPQEVMIEVQRIAFVIAKAVHLCGVLAIEMFLTKNGGIYVNEIAPRPHNSGHFSIEACNLSQFDAHIRGICNWPLPNIKLFTGAVMVNILGRELYDSMTLIGKKADWHFHYYGKTELKPDRKMGHITVLTKDIPETLEEIYQTAIWD